MYIAMLLPDGRDRHNSVGLHIDWDKNILITQIENRNIAGIRFARSSIDEATTLICNLSQSNHSGHDVHLLNAYSLALAERDSTYRDCLEGASINFPDGKPLSILTKFSREPLGHVRGPSFFESVMDEGRNFGVRHFLLGTTEETLELLSAALRGRYPGVEIVGTLSPAFRSLTQSEIEQQDLIIRATSPDIVWVGLGTPKQDFEARRLARENGFLSIAIGAAFDFSAGTKRESPAWINRLGAEWIYRFASEPRRLWRRYFFGNFIFLWSITKRGTK